MDPSEVTVHTVIVEAETHCLSGRLAEMVRRLCEKRDKIADMDKGRVTLFWAGEKVSIEVTEKD